MSSDRKLLIVDDEPSLRCSLSMILERRGYLVETAETGREALEKAEGESFHLALLDLRLPDMEGLELMEQLKRGDPALAVVIMSGCVSVEMTRDAVARGAAAYLTKPCPVDELLRVFETALKAGKAGSP